MQPESPAHLPVLVAECLEQLRPRSGANFIDCTVNGGGHSSQLLERSSPMGRLLALDADPQAIEMARKRLAAFGPRVDLVHSNFRYLADVAATIDFPLADGILIDLGFSTHQIESESRGFSFNREAPLDMRYDTSQGEPAAAVIASATAEELEGFLRTYGEEPFARRIAGEIIRGREAEPLCTTRQLADLVARVVGGRRARVHPATKTFQALRIVVNDELGALAAVLPQAVPLLRTGGRLAVISFHSLEDRIVKTFMRRLAGRAPQNTPRHIPIQVNDERPLLRLITPHPLSPRAAEIARVSRPERPSRVAERV